MPKFNVAVPHQSQRDDVVLRLKDFADQVRQDAPIELTEVTEQWDDRGNLSFEFRAMGLKIAGTVVTCESHVTVVGQLPFAAVPFRGQIERQIETKVMEALL